MDYEVKNVKMDNEFKICPTCGYKDGFHSMFKKDGDITKWLFICPSCHHIFDIGFTV
jgi:transposase